MKTGIVILSDRCSAGEAQDLAGPILSELVAGEGWEVAGVHLLPDDAESLSRLLRDLADEEGLGLILTSGGTGLAPRDITPEATSAVIEREIPGIPELLRRIGSEFRATAVLSRMVAGLRGGTLIVNLPGSPAALRECWPALRAILPHAGEVASGLDLDCGRESEGGD